MSNNSQQLPSIKISYSGSGVRFLRILGWVNIFIFILVIIILLAASGRLFGYGGFSLVGFFALLSLPTLMLFSGVCFALATIAKNALMSKAVLESKYNFIGSEGAFVNVEREIQARNRSYGECLPRDPKTRNN